jgi:hypothetical protein
MGELMSVHIKDNTGVDRKVPTTEECEERFNSNHLYEVTCLISGFIQFIWSSPNDFGNANDSPTVLFSGFLMDKINAYNEGWLNAKSLWSLPHWRDSDPVIQEFVSGYLDDDFYNFNTSAGQVGSDMGAVRKLF